MKMFHAHGAPLHKLRVVEVRFGREMPATNTSTSGRRRLGEADALQPNSSQVRILRQRVPHFDTTPVTRFAANDVARITHLDPDPEDSYRNVAAEIRNWWPTRDRAGRRKSSRKPMAVTSPAADHRPNRGAPRRCVSRDR